MAKDRAITTPSRTPDEQLLESVQVVHTSLESFKNDLRAGFTHANTILADLQKRVSILEQRQGREENKQGQRKRMLTCDELVVGEREGKCL